MHPEHVHDNFYIGKLLMTFSVTSLNIPQAIKVWFFMSVHTLNSTRLNHVTEPYWSPARPVFSHNPSSTSMYQKSQTRMGMGRGVKGTRVSVAWWSAGRSETDQY